MNIKPLAERVVIKMLEAEETTKSGILLQPLLGLCPWSWTLQL